MPTYAKRYAYRALNEDEYVFNCMVNYPEWAKKELTPRELLIFKSHSSIRAFVNNASHDQKRLILAKANIHNINLFFDLNKEKPAEILSFNELFKQFKDSKHRADLIKSIQEKNTFATSSREVLANAYLIAQNCHTPYYYLNMHYKRVYSAVESVKMKNLARYDGTNDSEKLTELDMGRNVLANIIIANHEAESYLRMQLKLDWLDLYILLFLFIHRETYVEFSALVKLLYQYSKKAIGNRMYSLQKANYLVINYYGKKRKQYTIAEMGIIAVCSLMERIAERAMTL